MSNLVLAVDGPSGAGKSSTARGVARRLGLRYLDTGAMYRAVTWWMLRHEVPVDDPGAVAAHAQTPRITVGTDPSAPAVGLDGVDVAVEIRSEPVTLAVSEVSAVPEVRARLVAMQREIVGAGGIVVEGRDIGSVVCPEAQLKIYLVAEAMARAERRTAELRDREVSVGDTRAAMARRDAFDSGRPLAPLARAHDAIEIDTTQRSLEEVITTIVKLAEDRDVS